MSNILIGIIGVILFIGIALAGSLILGQDFLTASSAGKSAGLLSITDQVVRARQMFEIRTGLEYHDEFATPLAPRFITHLPVNPTNAANPFHFLDKHGRSEGRQVILVTAIGANMPNLTCLAVAEQANQDISSGEPPTIKRIADLETPFGCFRAKAQIGEIRTDRFYVYRLL